MQISGMEDIIGALQSGRMDRTVVSLRDKIKHLRLILVWPVFKKKHRHHKGRTILENLNIDMIQYFPGDSFHLLYLGMKWQLLHYWCVQWLRLQKESKIQPSLLFVKRKPIDFYEKSN
jgi:hypothetical protein